jgi:hypothetical protein
MLSFPQDFSGSNIEAAPGTIFGVRRWMFMGPEGQLYGAFMHLWAPGVNEAVCLAGENHLAPNSRCTCGFFAHWKSSNGPPFNRYPDRVSVLGVIEGWGRTCIGTKGFRCRFAQIRALSSDQETLPWLTRRRLRRVWNVPVFQHEKTMLHHFPVTTNYLPKE